MKKTINYLKEGLKKALEQVEYYEQKINEEERKTTTFPVRVVVETKYEDGFWCSTILAEMELTLKQREKLIANLAWLNNSY